MENFLHSLMDNNITQSDTDSVVDFLKKNKKNIRTKILKKISRRCVFLSRLHKKKV